MHRFIGFLCGGDENVLERYGCCNIAHAKRTLHIKYPNNISNAMLYSLPKRKQIIMFIKFYSVSELVVDSNFIVFSFAGIEILWVFFFL